MSKGREKKKYILRKIDRTILILYEQGSLKKKEIYRNILKKKTDKTIRNHD